MVARSPTASSAARIRSFRSLSESVGLSPVVPTTTSPSEPWSTRYSASRWKASKSIFPFSWNGVAIAVRTEPSIRGIVCRMRYVLVHGAWHGGWCWERVARELASRGHDVAAPDLPSDEPGLTQVDYAALISPQPDAVVVGQPRLHGPIRTATAPRPPGRPRSSGRRHVSTPTPARCARSTSRSPARATRPSTPTHSSPSSRTSWSSMRATLPCSRTRANWRTRSRKSRSYGRPARPTSASGAIRESSPASGTTLRAS